VQLPVLPVVNAMLPRPQGGNIDGVVLDSYSATVLMHNGTGKSLFLCPWDSRDNRPYHVGVVAYCSDLHMRTYINKQNREYQLLHVRLEGQERAKVQAFIKKREIIYGDGIDRLDLKRMRADYPVLCGAGWRATDGFTECNSYQDIRVVINGVDYESGTAVQISGNLGGLVSAEQAHTIEHAIIRSLNSYGLCTAKILVQSIIEESAELKKSVEWGMKFARPELFGITESGVCGNPLTNAAQIFMTEEFSAALEEGRSIFASVEQARRKAMSRLTTELELTSQEGLRVLQGLKKGMFHDDAPLSLDKTKKILYRFPESPWL
jgi:hypothetical protein